MRKDSVLADKETVSPVDLKDKPLILSQQEAHGGSLTQWIDREISDLNIIATYNLLYNTSLLVDEGLGYAIGYDKIINTGGKSRQELIHNVSTQLFNVSTDGFPFRIRPSLSCAPGQLGARDCTVFPNPLPPDVAKRMISFPVKS